MIFNKYIIVNNHKRGLTVSTKKKKQYIKINLLTHLLMDLYYKLCM